jgi:hypothetical protein
LEVSNYSVAGDVRKETPKEYELEIARIKQQVNLATRLLYSAALRIFG